MSGGTPPRGITRYWGGSIPWATPTEISDEHVRYLDSTRESITEAGLAAAGLRILPADSVLVTTRATIGATARVRTPLTTNQGFQNLVPRPGTDPAWLLHAVTAARPAIRQLAAGSTFKEVSRESFRTLRLLVPRPDEQRAIAAVLDAIDDAVERTEAVVAATETLREALLHELLNRGVPTSHTKWRFDARLGQLPACWEVRRLGELLLDIEAGGAPPRSNRPAAGTEWGVLRVGALTWGEYRPSENKALAPGAAPDATLEVHAGDLLLSRANTPELVGRTVLVRDTPPRLLLSDKTLRLVPDLGRTDQQYLHLALASPASRRQLSGAASGSSKSMFNIAQTSIREIVLPLPPASEQRRIVEAMAVIQERHAVVTDLLRHLQVLKCAASDALLTGQLRVGAALAIAAT